MVETGGFERKLTYVARRGCPDRLAIWKHLTIAMFEIKAPGKKPTQQQVNEHDILRASGIPVYTPSTFDEVDRDIAHALANPILR